MSKATIDKLVKGEYFRFKENGPVWIVGDFDRELGKYSCYKFDDINHETFKRGSVEVWVDFEF